MKGVAVELVAARRRESPHGPIANRLWAYIEEEPARFVATIP